MIKFESGSLKYVLDEGDNSTAYSYKNVSESNYIAYTKKLTSEGFCVKESRMLGKNTYKCFVNESEAVFTVYYPELFELCAVSEPLGNYFSLKKSKCGDKKTVLIQPDLEDYGISYILRLNNGDFVIIDGGWDFEPDADKLMNEMKNLCGNEKPHIAAWFITHPHIDHYRCFNVFCKKYKGKFTVDEIIYNFPAIDETIKEKFDDLNTLNEYENLLLFERTTEENKITKIKAHTGQLFELANAKFTVLSSQDDIENPEDANEISLVLRLEAEGQIILFGGDCYFDKARIAERYGEYLKADLFSVPHHGFCGGDEKANEFISPDVCLFESFESDALCRFSIYDRGYSTLIYSPDVKEIFFGGNGTYRLELPYHTPRQSADDLKRKVEETSKHTGARVWVFDNVKYEDLKFSILNMISESTEIFADLYFEDSESFISSVKIAAKPFVITNIDFAAQKGIDGDALYFNRDSLAKKGLDPSKPATVVFRANTPVVISGVKNAVYHS